MGRHERDDEPSSPGTNMASNLVFALSSRYGLAVAVLAIFAATVYFGFKGASGSSQTWENTKDLLQVVIPIETGLLGTVTGYFFGKGK